MTDRKRLIQIDPRTNREAPEPSGGTVNFISWHRLTEAYLQRLEARHDEKVTHLSIEDRGITYYIEKAE